jgi:mutator protein MutT
VQAGRAEHLVAGGILRRGNSVLLCRRSAGRRWYPGTWDLPGGHVEDGELPAQTLRRELFQEIGVVPELSAEPFADVRGADYRMFVWLIDIWSAEPVNLAPAEHDAIGWFTLRQARRMNLSDSHVLTLIRAAVTDEREQSPGQRQ